MTLQNLQDALAAELTRLFDGYLAPAPDRTRKPLYHFTQEVPTPDVGGDDQASTRCPYTLTILQNGTEDNEEGVASVAVVCCICDYGPEKQGHREVLHIIHTIKERFRKEPLLDGQFVCLPKIEWVLEEEQPWPLYFGGLRLTFQVPAIQREDDLA